MASILPQCSWCGGELKENELRKSKEEILQRWEKDKKDNEYQKNLDELGITREQFVDVAPFTNFDKVNEFDLDPTRFNGSNQLQIHVYPNPAGHILLVGLLDNLGKGASGVAVQCLNLMLGLPEHAGLPA